MKLYLMLTHGGLANQLFQYAVARAMASRFNLELVAVVRVEGLRGKGGAYLSARLDSHSLSGCVRAFEFHPLKKPAIRCDRRV